MINETPQRVSFIKLVGNYPVPPSFASGFKLVHRGTVSYPFCRIEVYIALDEERIGLHARFNHFHGVEKPCAKRELLRSVI